MGRSIAFLVLASAAPGIAAQQVSPQYPLDALSQPRPSLAAWRAQDAVVLDGVLDEADWQRADTTDAIWLQTQPNPGFPFSEPTVVRIMYDDENLYIGARMYDREPDRITVPGIEQDYNTTQSDLLGFALDTFLDRQNAFLFAINPEGAIFDAQAFNDQQSVNRSWEGVIHVETTQDDSGWTVEVAVPFSTLRYDPTLRDQTWGLNFSRRIRRRNEDGMWAPLERQFRIYKMSQAGTLTGLRDLPRTRNLNVKPYLASSTVGNRPNTVDFAYNTDVDVGLDVKYGLTSQLTLDLTVNTDFSQAEVDAQQVNLTRFSLFFPEQRDFFLENEGVFAFGDNQVRNYRLGSSPRSFKLFHSRRIGLSGSREPIPVVGGARLTGRAGSYEIGLLNMQTRSFGDLTADNFGVVRVRRNVLTSSDVGVMFITRQPTSEGSRGDGGYTFGTDANFRISNLLVNTYVARTSNADATGDQNAGFLQFAWRDPLWSASTLVKHVGDGFKPEVGFVDRRGIRRVFATVAAHPQPDIPGILEINPYFDVDVFSDLNWDLETRILRPGVVTTLLDGTALTLEHTRQFESLVDSTAIAGVLVAPGDFNFNRTSVRLVTSGARRISGDVSYGFGDFYDGSREATTASVTLRPTFRFQLDLSTQLNRLELAGQEFDANLYSARFRLANSTTSFLSGSVQYNEASGELLTNVRYNWIHSPLSDVFLVLTERRNTDLDFVVDRLLSIKVTKLWSF